jgi:uncharacterized membrane protein
MDKAKKIFDYFFGTTQRALVTIVITLIVFAITNVDETKNFIESLEKLVYDIFQLILTIVIMIAGIMIIVRKGILK